MEAKMTLWRWVAFMDYPIQTDASPKNVDDMSTGSDFTEMLDGKLTEFTKAKQAKPGEPVMGQDELLEMIHSLFRKADKEDILNILAELEKHDDISLKEYLPTEVKTDTELNVILPNQDVADEQQIDSEAGLSEEERQHFSKTPDENHVPNKEPVDPGREEQIVSKEFASSQESVVEFRPERGTAYSMEEMFFYPETAYQKVDKTGEHPINQVESASKVGLVETIRTLLQTLPAELREELLNKFTNEFAMEEATKAQPEQITAGFPLDFMNSIPVNDLVDVRELEREANELFVNLEQKLTEIKTQEDIVKAAPKILEYLMTWQQLSEKAGNQIELLPSVIRGSNQQSPVIWQDLVTLYQQKMNFHTKSVYALESKVTNSDIVRWLSNTLNMTVHHEQPVAASQAQPVQMPISQVEQMVIHLPQNSDNNQAGKVLLEQFNRLIDSKNMIFQQPKGQLAITLKPANLGEMLVRFTQVDGEMLVKIMVTTKAAKEMLEANGQQLRHMFAPHQVVIERSDTNLQQSQAAYKEEGQAKEQEQSDESSSGGKGEKDENETFASLFDELILNEKV